LGVGLVHLAADGPDVVFAAGDAHWPDLTWRRSDDRRGLQFLPDFAFSQRSALPFLPLFARWRRRTLPFLPILPISRVSRRRMLPFLPLFHFGQRARCVRGV